MLRFIVAGALFTIIGFLGSLVDLEANSYIKQCAWSWVCIFSRHGLAIALNNGVWWPFALLFFLSGIFAWGVER